MDKIIKAKLVLPAYLTVDARELIRSVSCSIRIGSHTPSPRAIFQLLRRQVSSRLGSGPDDAEDIKVCAF